MELSFEQKLARNIKQLHHSSCEYFIFGDSMVARFQDYGTGRGLLSSHRFINIAVGGSTVHDWNSAFHTLEHAFSQIKIEKGLVLMLGTNDIALSASDLHDRFTDLICKCHFKSKKPIFVLSVLHRRDNPELNDKIDGLNAFLNGLSFSWLHYQDVMQLSSYLDTDLLHLTREGYEQFAQVLLEILK